MTINYFLQKELSKYKGIYLETGLSNGDSLYTASKLNFSKLISIEINSSYIDKAKKRFSKEIENNKIEILEGNSSLIIEDVLRKYRNIDVIYLDAHFHVRAHLHVGFLLHHDLNVFLYAYAHDYHAQT